MKHARADAPTNVSGYGIVPCISIKSRKLGKSFPGIVIMLGIGLFQFWHVDYVFSYLVRSMGWRRKSRASGLWLVLIFLGQG